MFLTEEDIQEIRIFRSRLIRVKEHKVMCPNHLSEEITQIICETRSVRHKEREFYMVDLSIMPIVRFFLDNDFDFPNEVYFGKTSYGIEEIDFLIEFLRRI